jgi:hypothetical protein
MRRERVGANHVKRAAFIRRSGGGVIEKFTLERRRPDFVRLRFNFGHPTMSCC